MPDELVPLCQCWDVVEAHSLRASFEARGVRAQVDGEHHRSMFGMVGAGSELRIMVPASQLARAQEIAGELIPDFAPEDADEDDAEDDEDDADEGDAEDDAERPEKKSIPLAMMLFRTGMAIGIIHMYADRFYQGLVLLLAAALGLALILGGEPWGMVLIAAVWFIDRWHGIHLLHEHNRELEASAEQN
jgi:hypothetical protein